MARGPAKQEILKTAFQVERKIPMRNFDIHEGISISSEKYLVDFKINFPLDFIIIPMML